MTRAAEPAAATNKVQLEIFPPLQEIHKRVMALSFRDCHTKIRHVDAHATLNEGVVVQVMGELSNNMQPMRKFMQTFVLAPEVCTCAVGCLEHCFCCSHADLLFFSSRERLQTNSTSTTTCFVTRTRCSATLILSPLKVA